jgi:4-hydroxy-tetrahydrodipicolinate synthase
MGTTGLQGCGTALVTPFTRQGALDEAALRRLVHFQIDQGIHFLVPCGTTGESPTLTHEEHLRVVGITLEEARAARRKVPVFAGAGGNNTAKIVALVRELETMGADGILSVSPYYNKPTQEGIYQHYRALSEATSLPIIVYNVPGRTGSNIEPATLALLAALPHIAGAKEASGSITQIAEVLSAVPEGFAVLSGDDAITLPLMALGGVGIVSVASNEAPALMAQLAELCLAGDFAAARRLNRRLLPLMQINFIESNPIPVKAALAMMGLIEETYRLPLVPMQPENRAKLQAVLESQGLLAAESPKSQVPSLKSEVQSDRI